MASEAVSAEDIGKVSTGAKHRDLSHIENSKHQSQDGCPASEPVSVEARSTASVGEKHTPTQSHNEISRHPEPEPEPKYLTLDQ